MKRRLNILCVIVVLVLGYSVLETGYYFGMGLKLAVEAGGNASISMERQKELMNMKYISLMPENFSYVGDGEILQDSVYNEKSGTYVSASYGSLLVSVNTTMPIWMLMVSSLLPLLHLGVCVWAIALFIRLIISINKSDIFNWKNVRRLRFMGLALIISFCTSFLPSYFAFKRIGEVFALRGYKLDLSDTVNTTILVLGISTLIVAEVFAIGLKMKEEQDLTI
ncbi:MAG: DUF2975 domain-containing protein [Bacteroides sp.]|nr:DUF2975 domain-containing protein [Bacteroides sp.]